MSESARHLEPTHEVTWEAYLALPDNDRRELVDGALLELEVPTDLHEHIVATLIYFLKDWARGRGALVLASGYKVRISPRRAFMPDVQLYRADNPARGQRQGLERGAPDLAVEVISPGSGRYDRVLKLEGYASIGAPEYWIVDPELRVLQRLILREGLYAFAEGLTDTAIFKPASFEGLEVPLAELWHLE